VASPSQRGGCSEGLVRRPGVGHDVIEERLRRLPSQHVASENVRRDRLGRVTRTPFDATNRIVMVWDNDIRAVDDYRGDLIRMLAPTKSITGIKL